MPNVLDAEVAFQGWRDLARGRDDDHSAGRENRPVAAGGQARIALNRAIRWTLYRDWLSARPDRAVERMFVASCGAESGIRLFDGRWGRHAGAATAYPFPCRTKPHPRWAGVLCPKSGENKFTNV